MCDASSVTLPFGASASVHNFLRVSGHSCRPQGVPWGSCGPVILTISLWYLMQCIPPLRLACAKGLMSLFGFVYSEEKLAPFDYTAEILGVVVDLSKASQRKISISNKPSQGGGIGTLLWEISLSLAWWCLTSYLLFWENYNTQTPTCGGELASWPLADLERAWEYCTYGRTFGWHSD